MPRGDRTGPLGEGPMTGRQLGYGAGFDSPGFTQGIGFGRGRGRGFGLGAGFRNRNFYRNTQPVSSEPELNQLKEEVSFLKNSINSMVERLESMTEKETKNNK
jgi:hypothetical protein